MKIAVISDLHIGGETFDEQRGLFPAFLDHLESFYDEIVVLGDVFETLYITRPFGARREYLELIERYAEIARRFFRSPYRLYSGNHDLVARRRFGLPAGGLREVDGRRILFVHGHEFDPLYKNEFFARGIDAYGWFAAVTRRLGWHTPYRLAYAVDYKANLADGAARYLDAAQQIAREQNLDFVVMGHTHKEEHVVLENGGVYLNCGDCESRMMFAWIDTRSGKSGINRYNASSSPEVSVK